MDTLIILFVFPLLIIFSYLFDAFARKTKFPAVILLMFTGIITRIITSANGYDELGFLDSLIPVLGTIGLILIVLVHFHSFRFFVAFSPTQHPNPT